jgi:hypothetical protein
LLRSRLAALMMPFSAGAMWNSGVMSGNATPVIKTTKPSKNLPVAASDHMRHCMLVIGEDLRFVPSAQTGNSSMYS